MKKFSIYGLSLMLFLSTTSCSLLNGGGNDGTPPNLADYSDQITRFSEFATRIAFTNSDIAANKDQVCAIVSEVAFALENYEDPNATFASLKQTATNALNRALANYPQIDENLRAVIVLGFAQVLDSVFSHVQDRYSDLVNQEPARSVLIVSKAVAIGMNNACVGTQSLGSFSIEVD